MLFGWVPVTGEGQCTPGMAINLAVRMTSVKRGPVLSTLLEWARKTHLRRLWQPEVMLGTLLNHKMR